ncbi:MAG: ABC transporter substrate-binding protein [Azospirillum sp.]|nr:ABC transporter substrate-binding protein [Azospirillum sp.]
MIIKNQGGYALKTTTKTLGSALALAATVALTSGASAADEAKFRLGLVTFLSGAAAGPFGVPAANGAKVLIEALNDGQVPAPYTAKGINGVEIEPVIIDEAGGTTKQVEEYRNLVERQKVDAVIGYISSGDCLAVSPVVEELKVPTVFFDCGTSRLFEENKTPTYLFRTGPDAVIDNIAAARYLIDTGRKTDSIAGINQNYAWGQDSWADFKATMLALKPGTKVVAEQFPKIFQGQYGAEISAISVARPDVVHSSFWGGDMEALVLQGTARGLFDGRTGILTTGESGLDRFKAQAPNGLILGARGPFGALQPDTALSKWFTALYNAKTGLQPTYPTSKMAQAILGLKAAAEKAGAKPGSLPSKEALVGAFPGLTFESVAGTVAMSRAGGHQALQDITYGEYQYDKKADKASLAKLKTYAGDCVMPPDGISSADWIKAGFPGAKCN